MFRLWYPQLDIYDTIRRFGIILSNWQIKSPSVEHLFILDFYLANPPLLYDTHMTQAVREEFRKLDLKKKDDIFLVYPTAPLLFSKMQPIQSKAIQTMLGKDLIDEEWYRKNQVQLSPEGIKIFKQTKKNLQTTHEEEIVNFLTTQFSSIGDSSISELRLRTGLRKAAW